MDSPKVAAAPSISPISLFRKLASAHPTSPLPKKARLKHYQAHYETSSKSGEQDSLINDLDKLIRLPEWRNETITCLLAKHKSIQVMWIRFICAVNECYREPTDAFVSTRPDPLVLIQIFLSPRSRFRLQDIPDELLADALHADKRLSNRRDQVMISLTAIKRWILIRLAAMDEFHQLLPKPTL